MSAIQIQQALGAWPQLRPALFVPHSNAEHRELVAFLDFLIDDGEDENHPLASLMKVIGVLIEKYEDDRVPELEVR